MTRVQAIQRAMRRSCQLHEEVHVYEDSDYGTFYTLPESRIAASWYPAMELDYVGTAIDGCFTYASAYPR